MGGSGGGGVDGWVGAGGEGAANGDCEGVGGGGGGCEEACGGVRVGIVYVEKVRLHWAALLYIFGYIKNGR